MSVNFIGQSKVKSQIDSYSLKTLPHSMIFYGEEGSGRHTLCNYIAEKFQLDYIDVRETIGDAKLVTKKYTASALRDFILDRYTSVFPELLIFQAEDLQEKESAAILKMLEEPPANVYIVIIAISPQSLLLTIRNRAMSIQLESYDEQTLKSFVFDPSQIHYLQYANTPGQVIELCRLSNTDFQDIVSLAKSVFLDISRASYSNILNISLRFFPLGEGKFPFHIFLHVLQETCLMLIIESKVPYDAMILTHRLIEDANLTRKDKRLLFENYLFSLKTCLKV